MSKSTIDAGLFIRMFLNGAWNLESNKGVINELNVFPVPDGDTGTNMTMTIVSAVSELNALGQTEDMKAICKAISSGSLRGARGNSGVILSQLFRGFCKVVRDNREIDIPIVADAFDKAVETAYKAVMKPKEGTILTVAKGAATKARELADAGEMDFEVFIPAVIEYAEEVLEATPEMLPVLKQAGVVDSGGRGLLEVLRGTYEGFNGREVDVEKLMNPASFDETPETEVAKAASEIKFAYRTSFYILLENKLNKKVEADLKTFFGSIGEKFSLEASDEVAKLSIDTNDPGLVLQKSLAYGALQEISIENRRLAGRPVPSLGNDTAEKEPEKQEAPVEQGPRKEMGIIAVAAGDGLTEIFKGLGVDEVVSGGQSMNPSTADILDAADRVNADTVFVLPNNKNIILAANQAAAMDLDKKLIVIPTRNVPQGISAVINFIPEMDAETNRQTMTEEIARIKSAEVTYAIKDTQIDDKEIREGDMMAIGDSGLLCVCTDKNEAALGAIRAMVDETTELISIFYGADATAEDAQAVQEGIQAEFPNVEVEIQRGGQPVYYYLLSAE